MMSLKMSYETTDQLYEDIQQTSPHVSINITKSEFGL